MILMSGRMKKKRSTLPLTVVLQLTEMCNLRCGMCYFWGERGTYSSKNWERKPQSLDFEIIKQLVNDLAPSRHFYTFFGGEPLMHPQIEEIIRTIKNAGSNLDAPTNGTLIADKAPMLVETGIDQIRVSIDGPQEINDRQRGKGSYQKAMEGIKVLDQEKTKTKSKTPKICIMCTITPANHQSIEEFFLKNDDFELSALSHIEINMEHFVTEKMGKDYSHIIKSEFGSSSELYWRGVLRDPEYFNGMDIPELVRQIEKVSNEYKKLNKGVLTAPPTFSSENLTAYITANWEDMTDLYLNCPVPWMESHIMASGEVAACHIFYDLIMGNLNEQRFEEIWYGEKYQNYREYMQKNKFLPICRGCVMLYLAGSKMPTK